MDYFNKAFIEPYYIKYISLPFSKLVSGYYEYEDEIRKDLVCLIEFCLHEFEYINNKGVYEKDGESYIISCEFVKTERCFRLIMEHRGVHSEFQIEEIKINEFGLIKSVLLEIPSGIISLKEIISDRIKTFLKNAYLALETSFEANSETLTNDVLLQLHGVVNMRLKAIGKESYIGTCNFLVFNDKVGFYFFDKSTITSAIKHFKKIQNKYYSPSILIIWLMTQPIPYPESLSSEALKQKKILSLPWKSVRFDKSSNFFQATASLHNFDDYSIYPVFTNDRGYSLTSVFRADNASEITPILDEVKDSLIEVFNKGMKNYSIFIKTIDKLKVIGKDSDISIIIGKIIGSAVSTFYNSQK